MATDLSGQIFGHYKLLEILGTGGMSLVYRAHQTNIDRDVAIKIMAPALSSQESFARRFKQEAEVFAKI
jgi:serine/threonine protein kinase